MDKQEKIKLICTCIEQNLAALSKKWLNNPYDVVPERAYLLYTFVGNILKYHMELQTLILEEEKEDIAKSNGKYIKERYYLEPFTDEYLLQNLNDLKEKGLIK